MELREARASDADGMQRVVRASLGESYEDVLDEDEIEQVAESDYDADRVEELLDDASTTVLVAANDEITGFVQGHLVDGDPVVADVEWLHVHPDDRGEEVGVRLLGELVDRFEDSGATIVRGRVLADNEDGGGFFEAHGFDQRGTDTVDVADETFDELVYEYRVEDADDDVVETTTGPDGEELYVDFTGGDRGNEAPFYPIYTDESLEDRWGWRCGNCDSIETTMDSSGRIKCAECGNTRKATRWDGSYL